MIGEEIWYSGQLWMTLVNISCDTEGGKSFRALQLLSQMLITF